MSIILAVLMIIILVITENMRRKKKAVPVFARQYFHPGHTWMKMNQDGHATIGVDEFAAGVLGEVTSVDLPGYLRKVRQGEPSFTVNHDGRSVTFVSPVTGRVVEKNEMVLRNPALAVVSPLQDGWLFCVQPTLLPNETRNLLAGKWADIWSDMARTHLLRFFSLSPVLVSHDGGRLVSDLVDQCTDEEWKLLKRDLFLDPGSPKEYFRQEVRQ